MSPASNKTRVRLIIGGVLLTLLLAAVFTLGSLDVPIEPSSWREVIALYAVSSFITAALLIFGLILVRGLVRLWTERSKQQLGARFKTKMVLGAVAVSLLPVIFMFFVSYALLNRTLGRWFPRPLEIASEETPETTKRFGKRNASTSAHARLRRSHARGRDARNYSCSIRWNLDWMAFGCWMRKGKPLQAEFFAPISRRTARNRSAPSVVFLARRNARWRVALNCGKRGTRVILPREFLRRLKGRKKERLWRLSGLVRIS